MPFLQDESLSSKRNQASTSSAMAVVQGTIYKEKRIGKAMSKAKALEEEFEELAERYSKLQRIHKLRESEILADFIKWNRCVLAELEKIKQKQAEFEARVNKLMVRIFKLEVRKANERKSP